jgi:polyvinyl alcohol dehydrogenase (cytochrome)
MMKGARLVLRLSLIIGTIGWVLPAAAKSGAALYMERCAGCHDHATAHVPPLSAIKAMTQSAIHSSLTAGKMQTQTVGLSANELESIIAYIAPTGRSQARRNLASSCSLSKKSSRLDIEDGWNGWSPSPTNDRFAAAGTTRINAATTPRLKLKWAFNLGDVTQARGQPTVVRGRVFVTTYDGELYALDANTGCTHWRFKAEGGLRSGVTLGYMTGAIGAFFGDTKGNIYAVNAESGRLLWATHPEAHPATNVTAAPAVYRGVVYETFSSLEEVAGANPAYECCTFRGAIVALDASSGRLLWKTYTIPELPRPVKKNAKGVQLYGPSGAGSWSTPTIDAEKGLLYVSTGDNYSDPPSSMSDAIVAIDMYSGALRWSKQLTGGDAYNLACPGAENCPSANGPDVDLGQPPILLTLAPGHRALIVGQKSGVVHALNPDADGMLLWQTRVGRGGSLGGIQWGSASDGQRFYAALSDETIIPGDPDPAAPLGVRLMLDQKIGGGLFALDVTTGQIVWQAKVSACRPTQTDCSPAQSAAVTVAPGVVFSGSVDGHMRAFATRDGRLLWDYDTAHAYRAVNGGAAQGGAMDGGGPAVYRDMLFFNSGYGLWGGKPGNVLLAFSLDGK